MVVATDDSRLARLEAQMEQVLTTLQDMQADIRANNARIDQMNSQLSDRIDQINSQLGDRIDQTNNQLGDRIDQVNARIDRLTLAAIGVGGGVIVALISLVGVLAVRLTQGG